MKNWEETDDMAYCSAQQDLEDALQVCETLGIPLHQINFSQRYWDRVFTHFLAEYKAGRTPNPDVLCNKAIKFDAFLNYARKLGADKIATGHYARIDKANNEYRLLKGIDPNKDQSYFLHRLGQYELSHSLFPLGELDKSTVRQMATLSGFDNHDKKDSTGICFIGERRFRDFLANYLPAQPGAIKTLTGDVIGTHQGALYYTIGQRQGLGIGGRSNSDSEPWYVVAKDVTDNTLTVVQGKQHPALYNTRLRASQWHWITEHPPTLPWQGHGKIRYRQNDQACWLEHPSNTATDIRFEQAQWAISPGQAVVLYQDDVCLGGGVIDAGFADPEE